MTISTEKLKQRIDRLRKQAADVKWVSAHAAQEMLEVADALGELLAVREAQSVPAPYNQVQRDMMKDIVVRKLSGNLLGETLDMDDIHAVTMELMSAGFRLYAAPPAPAVPAEITTEQMYNLLLEKGGMMSPLEAAMFAWDACRASAMKNTPEAASQLVPSVDSGNMQNTPGWISCSDCMPEENSPVLVCSSSGVVQRAIYSREGDNWNDWHGEYDEVAISAFSHWMPLPAAPTPTK